MLITAKITSAKIAELHRQEPGKRRRMKIQVKVKPNSRTEEVSQENDFFLVKVKEPPKEGKANKAVIKLLANHFGVARSQVRILSGLKSTIKLVEIEER